MIEATSIKSPNVTMRIADVEGNAITSAKVGDTLNLHFDIIDTGSKLLLIFLSHSLNPYSFHLPFSLSPQITTQLMSLWKHFSFTLLTSVFPYLLLIVPLIGETLTTVVLINLPLFVSSSSPLVTSIYFTLTFLHMLLAK